MARGAADEEIPRPPIQEGRHRSSTAEGVGGLVFQPRWGVASPPQPPPFLAGLISHFSWSSSSSNCFFPPVSPGGGLLTSGHKAPPRRPFSEAGSWRRDLAAASASAAGGAAPAPTGPAASWSSTRWTAERS